MSDELYRQDHFKVMAIFDLDVVMTLKPNMLRLTFQGLACILISDSWDHTMRVTILYNFTKIGKKTQFLHISAHFVTPIQKISSDLESRSEKP